MAKVNVRNDMVELGHIAVDSGQVFITDPCLLSKWNGEDDFNAVSKATTSRQGFGGHRWGVAVSTATGDGIYPVFGLTNADGLVTQIVIDLNPAGLVKDSPMLFGFGDIPDDEGGRE